MLLYFYKVSETLPISLPISLPETHEKEQEYKEKEK